MNEMKIFENEEFGQVRTVSIDGEPWFVGKDIATALGYKNTKDALVKHVDEEDKQILQRSKITTLENHIPKSALPMDFVSGEIPNRGLTIINESGVYAIIFGSKLPNAKKFKHWVTNEVLPSIRKTGAYGNNAILAEIREEMLTAINDISARVEMLESQAYKSFRNPFQLNGIDNSAELKSLNDLVSEVSELCELDRNRTLHYLYKTVEENLDISINSYLSVYRSETGIKDAAPIHVIASSITLYTEAVRLCQEVVERKKLFG